MVPFYGSAAPCILPKVPAAEGPLFLATRFLIAFGKIPHQLWLRRPALSGLRRTTAPATSNSGTQQGRVPECPGALPGQQRPDRISAAGSRERAHLGHRRHSAVEHRLPRPRARRRAPQWRDGARRHVGASWHRSVGSTSTSPAIHRSEALHRRMPSDLTHTIFLSCVDDMPASFPRSSSPGCLRR